MVDHEQIAPDEIDLRQILKTLSKWKVIIALITMVSVLTSGVLSFFVLEPVYESKTMLLVTMTSDKQVSVKEGDNLESLISSVSRIPQLTMNTYVNQLKSEILLERVSKKLSLNYSPGDLSGIITAAAIKDSNLIELKVMHNDPLTASKIANTISDQYLELISEKNQSQMTKSVGFLDAQREKVDNDLDEVIEKLKDFESKPGGVAFLEQQFTTKNQDLSKYQSMLNDTRVELRQVEAEAQQIGQELQGIPETVTGKRTLEGQTSEVVTEEANPVYVQLKQNYVTKTAQVAALNAKIQSIAGIIIEIRQDVDQIQKELVERKAELEKLESEKTRMVTARDLLAEKVTQTQIAKSIDLGDTTIYVVSPAMVPSSPVKPNKKLNIAVAFVLGLMIAVFVAFLMEFMDNTVKSPGEVTEKLNVPVLGVIPYVASKKN